MKTKLTNVTFFYSQYKKNVLIGMKQIGPDTVTLLVPRALKLTPYEVAYDVEVERLNNSSSVYRVLTATRAVNKIISTKVEANSAQGLYGTVRVFINDEIDLKLSFWGDETPFEFYTRQIDIAKKKLSLSEFRKWKMQLQSLCVLHDQQWKNETIEKESKQVEPFYEEELDDNFDPFDIFIY